MERVSSLFKVSKKKKKLVVPDTSLGSERKLKIKKRTASFAVLIAIFRLYRAKQAMNYARKGYLVITDRWPTKVYGKMDGPVIRPEFEGGYTISFLRKMERRAYDAMPEADACFVFQVPISVAIERNASRSEKEDEGVLVRRHQENSDPRPICFDRVFFNNEGALEEQRNKFRKEFWNKVAAAA